MFEKRWKAVPPQNFTASGTATGKITVTDASLFKAKQKIIVVSNTQPNLNLQVQSVDTATELHVGPIGSSLTTRTDLSLYLVADTANIYANEQPRSSVPEEQVERITYEEEPVVARRVVLVDKLGDKIDEDNPLPVNIDDVTFTGDINVKLTDKDNDPDPGDVADIVRIGDGTDELAINSDGSINVITRLTACDNYPNEGDIHSSIRISDCTNDLDINADGSINVNIVTISSNPGLVITHSEITAVAASVETTILTIVASSSYRVKKIEVSGENVALFRVKVNGGIISNKRSWWTEFNQTFDFENFENGLLLSIGDILTVTVFHTRPMLANFEATVMAN